MELTTKYRLIDDRYWTDGCNTPCFYCKFRISFARHTCSRQKEIPPDIWNNLKVCSKRESIKK